MKRALLALVLAALAVTALAADPPSSSSMSGSPKPPPAKSTKKAPAKLTPAQERLVEVQNAKAKFMAAVGSCAKPEECDRASPRKNTELVALLKSAEDVFMEACVQCASDKDCEEERDKILGGKGRYGYNVCVAKGTKTTDKKSAEKKAAEKKPTTTAKPAATTAK
jgi:hypothetical protein